MKSVLTFTLLTLIAACGKNGSNGAPGADGATTLGLNGVSNGVDFTDIAPGLVCATGGVSIFTFRDTDGDGLLSLNEDIIKVKSLCNGVNGADGQNGTNGTNGTNASVSLESVASSPRCPSGGIKLTSSSALEAVEVCNGINGLNGEQGLPGVNGIPGLAGANGADGKDGKDGMNGQDGKDGQNGVNGNDGTRILPVRFCEKDDSTFPEYGLMIGEELFAVYWGTTPASPKTPQAFLTKLVPGDYMSTGGNNCLFTIK